MSSFSVEDRHDHSLEKNSIYRRLICHSMQSYIDFKEKVDILKKRQKKTKQNKWQSDRQADRLTSQTSYVTWEVQDHVNRRFGGAKISILWFTFSLLFTTYPLLRWQHHHLFSWTKRRYTLFWKRKQKIIWISIRTKNTEVRGFYHCGCFSNGVYG